MYWSIIALQNYISHNVLLKNKVNQVYIYTYPLFFRGFLLIWTPTEH